MRCHIWTCFVKSNSWKISIRRISRWIMWPCKVCDVLKSVRPIVRSHWWMMRRYRFPTVVICFWPHASLFRRYLMRNRINYDDNWWDRFEVDAELIQRWRQYSTKSIVIWFLHRNKAVDHILIWSVVLISHHNCVASLRSIARHEEKDLSQVNSNINTSCFWISSKNLNKHAWMFSTDNHQRKSEKESEKDRAITRRERERKKKSVRFNEFLDEIGKGLIDIHSDRSDHIWHRTKNLCDKDFFPIWFVNLIKCAFSRFLRWYPIRFRNHLTTSHSISELIIFFEKHRHSKRQIRSMFSFATHYSSGQRSTR